MLKSYQNYSKTIQKHPKTIKSNAVFRHAKPII
uniref:Uncharacterized protein n=1 Tax=Arundo donax TaxID=35708 RepID=A0A0A9AZM5_ARUDO